MNLIERKSVKLLALGAQRLGEMTAEALCDAPQAFVIRRQLADLRALLDEFEDAYFFDPGTPPTA